MSATDQLRAALRDLEAKARERELDKKIESFADQADQFLRQAAARAGELAAENRERIDAKLAQAGESVDSRTDGKYHSYVDKVRSGVLSGVDWVAEQGQTSATAADGRDRGSAASPPTEATADAASPGVDVTGAPAASPAATEDLGDEGTTGEGAWVSATDPEPSEDPTDR